MSRKRILYLVHRTPYPPNRGHRIRSFHWLDYLAQRADVDLAFLADGPISQEHLDELRARCRQVTWDRTTHFGQRLRGIVSLLRGRSVTEAAFNSQRLNATLSTWVSQKTYDWIIAYCSSMAIYLKRLPVAPPQCVVDLVDVDSQKWLDYAERTSGLSASLYRLEGNRLRRLERELDHMAKFLVFVTEQESRIYQAFCATDKIRIVENGVDLDYFNLDLAESLESSGGPLRLVFVGAMDYYPNVDGVRWFIREVWPRIRKDGEVVFEIVGAGAKKDLAHVVENTPGVRLVGDVPDVRPYLHGSIGVIPLRIARGLQNKVLEAMAMGCPVVASPVALEGLDVRVGEDVLSAREADEWVAELTQLIRSPVMRRKLGIAARTRIESRYRWSDRLKVLEEMLAIDS
ncbi:MAG: TIGR03087 family PEP-CTERM/XrtA system glycosyltransferase [Thermogutta sp.]